MPRIPRPVNAMPTLLLRSPAHRLLSGRYALLEFTGRTSGRTYRTPIAYVLDGERVLISTDSPWWRNLAERPTVRLRLRGRDVTGTARVLEDEHEAAEALRQLVDRVPGYSRAAGIRRAAGGVDAEELVRAVTTGGRRSIEIRLEVRR